MPRLEGRSQHRPSFPTQPSLRLTEPVTLVQQAIRAACIDDCGAHPHVTARDKSPATREINGGTTMLRPRE